MAMTNDDIEPGPWIDELVRINKRDGRLDREPVLNEAKRPSSPLHAYFTWDDGDAAHQYRLIQAGTLIRRAEVFITLEGGEVVRHRAFLHTDDHGYQPTARVMSNAEMRAKVLARLHSDMEVMITRYEKYSHLAEVKDAIAQLRRWMKRHGG